MSSQRSQSSETLLDRALLALPQPNPWPQRHLIERAAMAGRTRGVAVEILEMVATNPRWARQTVSKTLRRSRFLHSAERRLVQQGCFEIIRHHKAIDLCLKGQDSTAPLHRWLAFLVLSGLPPGAAAEQIDNGVDFAPLTNIAEQLRPTLSSLDDAEMISIVGSVDHHLATALLAQFGAESGDFIAASNQRAHIVLRTNSERTDRRHLALLLKESGVETVPSELTADGLVCAGRVNLDEVPAYRQGLFEVQDEASQLVTALVPQVAGLVIDFCAGAGGKSLALAATRADAISILALDTRSHALEQLRKRAVRAQSRCSIKTEEISGQGDLPHSVSRLRGQASLVMVDAPCTGSGVLRRHPEFRWQIDQAALRELPEQQLAILTRAAPLVSPTGTLLYSTCSVLQRENQELVAAFIERNPGWRQEGEALELLPHRDGTDGFFAVKLSRT